MTAFLFYPFVRLYGDIVITNDDMILNGKILEEKKGEYVKFGNYHGIFIIDSKQIKEIHRTERYEDDVRIFMEKGRLVDENDVKTNYQAGLDKLGEMETTAENIIKEETSEAYYSLLFSSYFNINMGKLSSVLPYSFGGSVIGDIPLHQFQYMQRIFLTGVRTDIGYFHSEKGVKRVIGLRVSAGPLWQFPLSIKTYHFTYSISPVIGIGWYSVRGRSEKLTAVKWNAALMTGPVFNISSAALSPLIKFDYIDDGRASLYGIGFCIGAGFRF